MQSTVIESPGEGSQAVPAAVQPPSSPASRESQRSALRRLLRNTVVLALLVAGALLLTEGIARVAFPPTRFEQKLRAQAVSPTDLEVAVNGSSRAARGIDPTSLAWRAYNFGDDGQSPNIIRQGVEHQLARQQHLRGVVLVLDEFAFGTEDAMVPAPDYVRWGYTLQFADDHWSERTAAWSWLFRYRHDLLPQLVGMLLRSTPAPSKVSHGDAPTDPNQICLMAKTGFIYTPDLAVGLTPAVAKQLATTHNTYYVRDFRAGNLQRLRELLEETARRNVRIAVVQPPLNAAYRRFIDPVMLADYKEDTAKLMAGLPIDRVCFRSYFDDARFPDGEFSDPDHLNSIGARHWARILSEELRGFFGVPTP